jgi:hypothetical protein
MNKRLKILSCILILIIASSAAAQENDQPAPATAPPEAAPKIRLTAETLFFTEPYIYLRPPVNNRIAMSLELDYAFIRYPFGFVNTLELNQPLVEFRKKIQVTDPDQLQKIKQQSGFQPGDRITVVSAVGRTYPARIESFSYVGNSPSTVIVAADLVIESEDPDSTLFNKHGVALRGMHEPPAERKFFAEPSLASSDPLRQKLLRLCSAGLPEEHVVFDARVLPAYIEPGDEKYYFVSYWQRPEADFEIEDIQLKSCLFKPMGDGWAKADMPLPMQVEAVYDLDRDDKAEIYAMAGDGAEICYIYLLPKEDSYALLKKGLCAGY